MSYDNVPDLLAKGADPNEHEPRQLRTPLHMAAMFGNYASTILLLQNDPPADPNALANGGYTPLHLAARRGHIKCVMALLEAGAQASLRNDLGNTARDMTAHDDETRAVLLEAEVPVKAARTT